MRLAINISGYQLRHNHILRDLKNSLQSNQITLNDVTLELEITESLVMQDVEAVIQTFVDPDRSVGLIVAPAADAEQPVGADRFSAGACAARARSSRQSRSSTWRGSG